MIELVTGAVYPDRCRASTCSYCLPLNARRRCLAITYAGPQRMVRLSWVAGKLDGSPCSTALTRIGLIRRNLKRMAWDPGKWCFTIEKNPKGTGYHAHCLQIGRSIPQDVLQVACLKSNAGQPDIRSIRRSGVWTSRYGLKGFGADGYGLKGFRPNGDSREALRINNGRMEHHSRGFYAIEGDAIGVRVMERLALAAMGGAVNAVYVGAMTTEVDRILGSDRLRSSLIRDVKHRNVAKLRAFN